MIAPIPVRCFYVAFIGVGDFIKVSYAGKSRGGGSGPGDRGFGPWFPSGSAHVYRQHIFTILILFTHMKARIRQADLTHILNVNNVDRASAEAVWVQI